MDKTYSFFARSKGKKKVEINALSSLPGCAAMGKFVLASGS